MKASKMKEKHVPMRTCIVTRKKMPKKDLIRIVRMPGSEIRVDYTGKLKGRGANISQDIKAFDDAIARGILARALKLEGSLTLEEINRLREEFKNVIEEKQFRPNNKPVSVKIDKSQLIKLTAKDD